MRGYISENIACGIAKATAEHARKRILSIGEIRTIWQTTYQVGPVWGPVFRLLLLTCQRRAEILGLRWKEITFDTARMTKPGSQSKNKKPHITHLSNPALKELKVLHSKSTDTGFVFTTPGDIDVEIEKVFSAFVGAKLMENLRASSRTPQKDRSSIESAAKGLRRAEKALSQIEVYGGQAIHDLASSIKSSDSPPGFRAVFPCSASGSTLAEAAQAVLQAVFLGEVTPLEAATVIGLIEQNRRVLEAAELERRITALEAKK